MERPNKGKSVIKKLCNYVVFDIETTGLSHEYDEIIELAALRVRGGKIIDKFITLVKPKNPVDEFIVELTGITNEMLNNAPDIKDVFPDFIDFVGNDIMIAHNANFDINFVYDFASLFEIPFSNDFVDTYRFSRKINTNIKNHKLKTLVREFSIQTKGLHRAESDAMVTHSLYNSFLEKCTKENINIDSLGVSKPRQKIDLKSVSTTNTDFDEDNYCFDKSFCFTGKMVKYSKKDAAQIVVDNGGRVENTVTMNLDVLVLGDADYQKSMYGEKSNKHKKAEDYIILGLEIDIIDEATFLSFIEKAK